MWSDLKKVGGITNKVTMPSDGVISIVKPSGVELCAYVNGNEAPLHHLHVRQGDIVHFELKGHEAVPSTVKVEFGGQVHDLQVTPEVSETIATAMMAAPISTYHEDIMGDEKVKKHAKKAFKAMEAKYKTEMKHLELLQEEKEMTPAETINLFANPGMGGGSGVGAGAGAGLGAGLLGGILGGALLGNRGLLGGEAAAVAGRVEGCATPTQVTATVNDAAMLQSLGDIKASIPFNESQVQLALAQQAASLTSQINNVENSITSQNSAQSLQNALGFSDVKSNSSNLVSNLTNILNTNNLGLLNAINASTIEGLKNTFALQTSITAEGVAGRLATEAAKDQVLAALNARAQLEDTRLITNQANEIIELRGDRRLAEATGNITITNTNTATAIAQQQQAQGQFQILASLAAAVNNLANDMQVVRQGQTIFNSGTMAASGTQTAANTRVS